MKRKLLFFILAAAIAGAAYVCFFPPDSDNQIPPMAVRAVEKGTEVILYSLHPYPFEIAEGKVVPLSEEVPQLHGYRILGQTVLASSDTRRAAALALQDALQHGWERSVGACFNPRHGIRATDDSGTYDFVICFQCKQMSVHLPDGTQKTLLIEGPGDELTRLLQAAKVPLPEK